MNLQEYRFLIQSFVDGSISIDKFESTYLHAIKNEREMDNIPFAILQNLFEDVDAYSPLWSSEDENAYRITEKTLRQEAQQALKEINQYMKSRTNTSL